MTHTSGDPQAQSNPQLQAWTTKFKKGQCSVYDASGALKKRLPILALLGEVKKIRLPLETHDRLENNILYACFRAATAQNPENDEAAQHRKSVIREFDLMRGHLQTVTLVRAYLDEHRNMADKAMAHVGSSGADRQHAATHSTINRLNDLRSLLSEYERGLLHISGFDHPAHISLDDFRYGPFEWHDDLYKRGKKSRDINFRDINETGLIFHLVYLFRYFTSEKALPPGVDIGRDILDVSGYMIESGRPHHALVAPLVNAVFNSKLNSSKVKDRLRDLCRFARGSAVRARSPKIRRLTPFLGWR